MESGIYFFILEKRMEYEKILTLFGSEDIIATKANLLKSRDAKPGV